MVRALMMRAAETSAGVVEGLENGGAGLLERPTPCPEYDVRALVGHLAGWMTAPALAAAHKRPVTGPPDESRDVTAEPGWAERLTAEFRETAEAWSDPSAWEGTSSLSGAMQMPAEMLGGIVLGEFLLHGWDLAVATGGRFTLDDDLARALLDRLEPTADMAREYKAFGPEVPVPSSAPPFDRALGLAGRDPAWTP